MSRRGGDRGRGGGAGALHADGGFRAAPTGPSPRRRSRSSRATDVPTASFLDWPFFEAAPPRASPRELGRLGRARPAGAVDHARRRRSLPRGSCAALGRGRLAARRRARAVSAGSRRRSTCARCASRARRWPTATASPISPSPCRGSAPAPITLFGTDGAEGRATCRGVARRRGDRRLRAVRARGRLRRRRDGHAARRTGRPCPHRRRQDLDLERRHRRHLRGLRAHRRGARRAGPLRLHGRGRRAGLTVAERIDVIAPHPLATLRFEGCRVPRREPARRRRARASRSRWRRSTCSARRSARRRSASPAARSTRRSRARARAQLFGAPLADLQLDAGDARRHGDRHRRRRAARLSRRVDQGPGRAARHPRGRDGQDVRDRGRAARHRPGGAALRRPRRDAGVKVEELYREIRALRIYEGATEVQKLVIAREMLKCARRRAGPAHLNATERDAMAHSAHVDTFAGTICRRGSSGRTSCSTCRSCTIRSG